MKVSSVAAASPSPALWHGPGAPAQPRGFDWRSLLWSLVFPPRRHRIAVTVPGLFLIITAMGIGSAAYNTASNILFITLSLLLACLLLSGLLSWFNFRGVCWRLRPPGPWRAGHETPVTVEVWNRKQWLPTYGLWFEFAARAKPPAAPEKEEALNVRAVLKAFEQSTVHSRLFLRERLEADGDTTLVWVHRPDRRGEAVIELAAVGSLYPFGFLRKSIGTGVKHTVSVWPAQVEYQWRGAVANSGGASGQRTVRAGAGDDLLALRRYTLGDSHRLIHWKASARLGHLMVRQFAAESLDGFVLQLDTPAALWTHPEQFELLCSFAGTLAEDLFAEGRLQGVRVNGGPPLDTRRVHDVGAFLDQLARLQPVEEGGADSSAVAEAGTDRPDEPRPLGQIGALSRSKRLGGDASPHLNRNVITFAPEGARGVTAYVDGIPTASA